MIADPTIVVRPRRDEDLPNLLAVLQRSHEHEGYPVRASAVRADWLAEPTELGAWVVQHGELAIAHIALHPTAAPGHDPGEDSASRQWQRATGLPADRLALVSRFVTDGSVPGAGTTLLAHAVRAAADTGRTPVLLVDPDAAARGFYLRRGWREVGTATQQWGEHRVDAALMVAPEGTRVAPWGRPDASIPASTTGGTMPPRIHVMIDIDGAEPTDYTADGFQTAADWLLDELGRDPDSPYPPVGDAAEFAELVQLITDKLGASGVDVRWSAD